MDELLRLWNCEEDPCVKAVLAKACRLKLRGLLGNHPNPREFGPTAEERSIYDAQGKIPCIKAVRSRTGLGLRDSKQLVEYVCEGYPKPDYFPR